MPEPDPTRPPVLPADGAAREAPAFLAGAGEMAARARAFDWASTPLGDPASWPPSLRTAVGICINSRFPMFVWWGPELTNIYNDAYAPVLGRRHPAAFGQPAKSIWAEIWDVLDPQVVRVIRDGQATWNERVRLLMERNGFAEETWFTWSYSPIPDDSGGIGGLFCACTEDTGRVLADRERERLADQRQVALDAARLGWWHFDPATQVATWDERFREIFGLTDNQRPNEEILKRIHPEDLPGVWAAVEAALDPRDPKPFSTAYRIRLDDSSIRWVEAHGLATFEGAGPDRRAIIFVGTVADITDRRLADVNHRFLVALDDAVRPLTDPAEITLAAATLLGRHLGVDRCAYADVEPDQDTMNLAGNYLRGPGIRSIVGRLTFTDFGAEVLALMRAGVPYVVHDVETHEPPVGDKAAYHATQIRAVICVPLQKLGRFVAAMAVHTAAPRRWNPDEVDLVRQVAGRCWESIERSRVMRTLRESEERYRTLFDTIDQGFCVVEVLVGGSGEPVDYRFLEANPAFDAQTGLANAVGRTALELVPNLDRWWVETYGRVGLTGEPARFENHAAAMDRWFEVYAFRFGPPQERRVAIFFKNITARKAAESRDRLLIELDNATRPLSDPEAINRVSMDVLGRHLDADRAVYIHVDDDQDSFAVGYDYVRGVPSMVGRYRLQDFGEEVGRRFRAGEPFVVEDVESHVPPVPDLGGYRHFGIRSVLVVPLLKGGRLVATTGVHQASPRRWSAAELEQVWLVANRCWESIERAKVTQSLKESLEAEKAARAEAERAGRMKDEFLASLSHELRTPLNAILGWSQILRSGPADAADLEQGLAVIERNARAQTQIIADLLDMSRIISGKLRLDVLRTDVGAALGEAIQTVQLAADAKGVRLHVVIDPRAGHVSGDPARLQQVFWNLLSNAVKFTPKGGRVQVVLSRVNSHLEVVVTDSGEGVAPEFLPHVFDRFRQADASTTRRHGGLGLGLAIARQLVELHGGTLRAHSPGSGLGATFTVSLPLTPIQLDPAPAGQRRHPQADHGPRVPSDLCVEIAGVKVLVVDDEPDARTLIRRLLEDCDAVVVTADSAGEALRAMEVDRPDVLVSDVGMPVEDGYTLIRRVRTLGAARGGDVPAVALTAYARSEDRTRSIAAGFQMHVSKPVEAAELITVIASLAGRTARRGNAEDGDGGNGNA